jgi:hypothetical protein
LTVCPDCDVPSARQHAHAFFARDGKGVLGSLTERGATTPMGMI